MTQSNDLSDRELVFPVDDLPRLVFEAIGAASLCWEPKPTGVFDTTTATKVAEQLVADIRAMYQPFQQET